MSSSRASRLRFIPAVAASTGAFLTLSVVTTGPLPGFGSSHPRPVSSHFRTVSLAPMADQALEGAAKAPGAPAPDAPETRRDPADTDIRSGAISPVQSTDGQLRVIGVTWPQGRLGDDDRVEYRVHDDGRWGGWRQMVVAEEDHAPDPGTEEAARSRAGTDPYVVTGDDVQVRVLSEKSAVAPDVRLDVIDPMKAPADDDAVAQGGAASAAGVRPTIYTRAQWGADESLRRGTPEYGTIKAGFVHHTVDANNYSAADVPAILRGIYSFHVKGRGWSDIGYNFLIDRFGRTWEGRAGGIDQPVIGAHTGGFNSQLFGAAAIGTYTSTTPPQVVLDAYSRLLAWKLGLAHVDPASQVQLSGMSTKVYAVSGHRDADGTVNDTECPGNALYSRLSTLRTSARALQGTMFYAPRTSKSSWSYGATGPTLTARANTSLTWTMTVKSPCRTETLATVRGSATATSPISAAWNGKLSSGAWAPPGDYDLTLSASSGSGTANTAPPWTVRVRIGATSGAPQGFCPSRVGGTDRFAVSVAAARAAQPSGTTVVIANGTDAAMGDALVAAPLARAKGGALLLTNAKVLPSVVASEITRRKATTAYLVGGTGSVGTEIETRLKALKVTTIVRLGGADRYAVAAKVASAVAPTAPDVMVASGDQNAMADGLVLSGPAASLRRPILLVRSGDVPPATSTALAKLGARSSLVAGGTATVSDAVLAQLPSPTRAGGVNRFEVSENVAAWARGVMPVQNVLVASGLPGSLADALSGGQFGRATLYVSTAGVPAPVASWLDRSPDLSTATVLGGPASVPDLVAGRVQRAVLS